MWTINLHQLQLLTNAIITGSFSVVVLGLEKFMFSLTADELHRERLKDSQSTVGAKIAGGRT